MFLQGGIFHLKRIDKVRIIPLGGLNEIGKNLTLIECGKDIIAIDCGIAFPDEDLPGVDYVIPICSISSKTPTVSARFF